MRYINWLTLVKGNWACWQGDWINEMHWLMMVMFLWSNWKLDWKRDVLICCTAWICEISCWRWKGGLLTMWIQPKVKHFNSFIADMRAEIEPGNPDLLETQTRQIHTGRGQNKNWMWSMKKGMQILMWNGKIGNSNRKCNVQFMSSRGAAGSCRDFWKIWPSLYNPAPDDTMLDIFGQRKEHRTQLLALRFQLSIEATPIKMRWTVSWKSRMKWQSFLCTHKNCFSLPAKENSCIWTRSTAI